MRCALVTGVQTCALPISLVREGLIDGIRPVRSLLVAIAKLPWQATGEHPAIEYLAKLQALYLKGSRKLPVEVVAPSLGMIWQRSEEHTSELQSLMRISYAVF